MHPQGQLPQRPTFVSDRQTRLCTEGRVALLLDHLPLSLWMQPVCLLPTDVTTHQYCMLCWRPVAPWLAGATSVHDDTGVLAGRAAK
jgi:hypothetical protein